MPLREYNCSICLHICPSNIFIMSYYIFSWRQLFFSLLYPFEGIFYPNDVENIFIYISSRLWNAHSILCFVYIFRWYFHWYYIVSFLRWILRCNRSITYCPIVKALDTRTVNSEDTVWHCDDIQVDSTCVQ